MHLKRLNRLISVLTLITFLSTNTLYAAPSSRSLFKNKQVDYKKLSTQSEQRLQEKKAVFQEEDEQYRRQAKEVLQTHLKDISRIHIPSEYGRVIEAYDASEDRMGDIEDRLIVHIQDLHTNPEAELNLAKILEILLKDYKLDLVCSEGADGDVDTSSVSSFPNYEAREKVGRIFINSGELTGEEYLSITKYPDLPIWGIEDRDIYFKNIIQFNKIMKFSPSSQVFISQTKKALEGFKGKVYSKDLLNLDQKELDYENKKIETDEYLKYLTSYIQGFNIPITKYRNVTLLKEATEQEKYIDQQKIFEESQNLLLNLRSAISAKSLRSTMDSLMVKAQLFKEQKISPFSFYSYLKDLADEHLEDGTLKYKNLNDFVSYLTKVNSLDSTRLFNEMEDLSYEVKQHLAKTKEQKDLTDALRNIKFLEGFFNLKVSNEELDYYLVNRESHKVGWFKSVITDLTSKKGPTSYIDFNPALIDSHLQELEEFYQVVKDRDIAMVDNSLSEIQRHDVKVAALIAGGFHTKGITRLLKDKGYSYIVVSPYSSTDIDEENYHFLLSGRRRPIEELLRQLDLPEIINRLTAGLRVGLALDEDLREGFIKEVVPVLAKIWGEEQGELTPESILERIAAVLALERGADRWESPIADVEIRFPVPGEIIMRLGTASYFKFTKGNVQSVGAGEFQGETLVKLTRTEPIIVAQDRGPVARQSRGRSGTPTGRSGAAEEETVEDRPTRTRRGSSQSQDLTPGEDRSLASNAGVNFEAQRSALGLRSLGIDGVIVDLGETEALASNITLELEAAVRAEEEGRLGDAFVIADDALTRAVENKDSELLSQAQALRKRAMEKIKVISAGNFIEGGMKIDPDEVLVVIATNERDYLTIKDVPGINIKVLEQEGDDWISKYEDQLNPEQKLELVARDKEGLSWELEIMYTGRISLGALEEIMQKKIEKRLGEGIDSEAATRAITRAIARGV